MSIGSAVLGAVLAAVSATGTAALPVTGGASALPTGRVADAPAAGRWAWPLDPRPEVVRRFDRPDEPWLPGHRGVDLAAVVGARVQAPADGRVSWAGVVAGRAVLVVAHAGGLRSTFEPVSATSPVGTVVRRGDGVGVVTATPGHCAPGTCVHWGVLRGETYLDPLSLVGRARVVLLPVP